MEFPILSDIVIILGLSVVIILLFQRLKIPAILGFLITGIVAGPHGLNLITATHEVELLAEIGIIFLLFVIGIEFSLKGLASIKNTVFTGGLLQVGGTIGVVAVASYFMGLSIQSAIFMGFLLSLSSTAIVLKMLQEKGELTAPHGKVSLGILIFQDIVVVLMMLLTPLLAGQMEDPTRELIILSVKMIAVVILVILLSRYIVPVMLGWVVKTKNRELFILSVVVLCFATAWLTSYAGLSLALGAFFAGLIISESDYSHQATANILPFREIFISFFFVSVGMLLDFKFFFSNAGEIFLLTVAVILLKIFVIMLTVLILRHSPRTILLSGFSIFQVGEFAFLLSVTGMQYDLLTPGQYQYFLAISIISMGASPFLINKAERITNFLLQIPVHPTVRRRFKAISMIKEAEVKKTSEELRNHLVIIGFGINGENVSKSAKRAGIPYVIVEMDPTAMEKGRKLEEPIVFGDATDEMILKHVHIQEARIAVVAISTPEATRQIVKMIRTFSETIYIIVRTRYVREVEEIVKLGADEVIPEEFETSIEIFTRVLKEYLIPNDDILELVHEIRSHNYEMLRSLSSENQRLNKSRVQIPDMEIAVLPVRQGKNGIVGKTISESGIRTDHGINVLAIKRKEKFITRISSDTEILEDDVLYVFGKPDDVMKVNRFLSF